MNVLQRAGDVEAKKATSWVGGGRYLFLSSNIYYGRKLPHVSHRFIREEMRAPKCAESSLPSFFSSWHSFNFVSGGESVIFGGQKDTNFRMGVVRKKKLNGF